MKLNVGNSGGSYKGPPSTGSANAAEHHYFPGTSTDRPAKKKPKKTSKASSSSSSYVSPFAATPVVMPQAPVWKGPSAMDMIMTQLPSPNIDYQKEATKIYQPTLDYLDSQSSRATGRAKANDKSLANLYGSVAGGIDAQAGDINKQYGGAINTVKSATKQGQRDVSANYDAAAAEQAQMMKQLGIEAAAPDVLKQGTQDEAFFQSLIGSAGTDAENFLTGENQSALQFNREQAGITRQEGANARADQKLQLEDILAQLSGKKVDLRTQINQQAQSMQSDAKAQQLQAQDQAMQALNADRQFAMSQANYGLQAAGFGLDQQRFGLQQQQATAGDELARARLALDTSQFKDKVSEENRAYQLQLQKLAQGGTSAAPVDPWGKGAQLATQLYGGNQQAASNAIQAVRDAIAANGDAVTQWKSPNDLVRAVLKRNPGANDTTQLTSLATYLYQQIFK